MESEIDLTIDEDSSSKDKDDAVNHNNDVNIEEIVENSSSLNFIQSDLTIDDVSKSKNELDNCQVDDIVTNSSSLKLHQSNFNINDLLKSSNEIDNGKKIPIFSYGPKPVQLKEEISKRPINCHLCQYSTTEIIEMKDHTNQNDHKAKILLKLDGKQYKPIYNFYNKQPKGYKIMFCIFNGENIEQVNDDNTHRLLYISNNSKKPNQQKIMLNKTKTDNLYDINKMKPLLGLEYCLKIINNCNFEYFCVLCSKTISGTTIQHFKGRDHVNYYIVRHFLITRNKIIKCLNYQLKNAENITDITNDVILEIYRKNELKKGFRLISLIEQNMFNTFQNCYIEAICKTSHYDDKTTSESEIIASLKQRAENSWKLEFLGNSQEEINILQKLATTPNETEENEVKVIELSEEIQENIEEADTIEIEEIGEEIDINENIEENYLNLIEDDDSVNDEFSDIDISNLEVSLVEFNSDPNSKDIVSKIINEEAINYCDKPSFGLEYLGEIRYKKNSEQVVDYFCLLCEKKLQKKTILKHAVNKNHRMNYIKKHFPVLKSSIEKLLKDHIVCQEEIDSAIGQIIAEICQKLKIHIGRNYNKMFKLIIKNFNMKGKSLKQLFIQQFIKKLHFNDAIIVAIFSTKAERRLIISKSLKRLLERRKLKIDRKRSGSDICFVEGKRAKIDSNSNIVNENGPITLTSVLALVQSFEDFSDEIKSNALLLLSRANDIEKKNGNISELMTNTEYYNFLKTLTEISTSFLEEIDSSLTPDKISHINKILNSATILIESMDEAVSDILVIEDDEEINGNENSANNKTPKKFPNPFSQKFKKDTPAANTSLHNVIRTVVNTRPGSDIEEITNNNSNISQYNRNINTPAASMVLLNNNVNSNPNRFNNPFLNEISIRNNFSMSTPLNGRLMQQHSQNINTQNFGNPFISNLNNPNINTNRFYSQQFQRNSINTTNRFGNSNSQMSHFRNGGGSIFPRPNMASFNRPPNLISATNTTHMTAIMQRYSNIQTNSTRFHQQPMNHPGIINFRNPFFNTPAFNNFTRMFSNNNSNIFTNRTNN